MSQKKLHAQEKVVARSCREEDLSNTLILSVCGEKLPAITVQQRLLYGNIRYVICSGEFISISLFHSYVFSFVRSFICSFATPLICLFVHPFVYLFVHCLLKSFTYSLILDAFGENLVI